MKYGTKVGRSAYKDRCEGIGEVDLSNSGNVVMRIGRELQETPGPWEQIAHVVLTPDEWDALVAHVAAFRAEAQFRTLGDLDEVVTTAAPPGLLS